MSLGILYVVATPIGHLGDLSERAKEVLSQVPMVAAEDTRRTRQLLHHLGCRPRVVSYHAHSDPGRITMLLGVLEDGSDVALVTDAGTPGISDPGGELIRSAREAGARVVPIPGPSAVAAALSASGMSGDRYLFLGFLPRRGTERRRLLDQVGASLWTVILFEAPPRVLGLFKDLERVIGRDRRVVVARELTKLHEEIRADTLGGHLAYWAERNLRGEFTLVIAGGTGPEAAVGQTAAEVTDLRAAVRRMLGKGLSTKEATARVTTECGIPRNEAYRLVMECRKHLSS